MIVECIAEPIIAASARLLHCTLNGSELTTGNIYKLASDSCIEAVNRTVFETAFFRQCISPAKEAVFGPDQAAIRILPLCTTLPCPFGMSLVLLFYGHCT